MGCPGLRLDQAGALKGPNWTAHQGLKQMRTPRHGTREEMIKFCNANPGEVLGEGWGQLSHPTEQI